MTAGEAVLADSVWWAGPVAGVVAATVFVVFCGWIVLARVRGHGKDDIDG